MNKPHAIGICTIRWCLRITIPFMLLTPDAGAQVPEGQARITGEPFYMGHAGQPHPAWGATAEVWDYDADY